MCTSPTTRGTGRGAARRAALVAEPCVAGLVVVAAVDVPAPALVLLVLVLVLVVVGVDAEPHLVLLLRDLLDAPDVVDAEPARLRLLHAVLPRALLGLRAVVVPVAIAVVAAAGRDAAGEE